MPVTKNISSEVILVNEQDTEIGTAEKLAAHQKGLLHRAFSIFIFQQIEAQPLALLLQQRADTKYHSPGLWTNTCCSHPHPGESLSQAATRRLREELNLFIPLQNVGHFIYKAHFENGLIEHELDHVLVGRYHDEGIIPDPAEIKAYRWVTLPDLKKEIAKQPGLFTPWLSKALILAESAFF